MLQSAVEALHSRYSNLKKVVLDKLLAEHGDAQLDAQFHEATCMGTLEEKRIHRFHYMTGNYNKVSKREEEHCCIHFHNILYTQTE